MYTELEEQEGQGELEELQHLSISNKMRIF